MKKSNLRMTDTACHIAAKSGVNADTIRDVYANGEEKDNEKFPGQRVVAKDGVSLIGVDKDETTFLVITMRTEKS